jgi:hypothetical protein
LDISSLLIASGYVESNFGQLKPKMLARYPHYNTIPLFYFLPDQSIVPTIKSAEFYTIRIYSVAEAMPFSTVSTDFIL